MPRDPSEQQKRNVATFGALAGLLFVALGILALAAMVIPDILNILLVLAAFLVIGVIQYALWGWKLDRYRIMDDDDSNPHQNS
jgi:Flp pilus assembly protein TadB